MTKYRQTEKVKTKKYLFRLIIAGEVIILGLVAFALIRESWKYYQIYQEKKAIAEEIESLKEKEGDLLKLVEYLDSSNFKEKEARLKLGLKKPGEQVVIITDTKSEQEISQPLLSFQESSNFKKWWNYFFQAK